MNVTVKKVAGVLWAFLWKLLALTVSYLLIEVLALVLLQPDVFAGFGFSVCWALIFAAISLMLPKLMGKIFFGFTYYLYLLWTLAQTGYYRVFGRMMWFSDVFFAGEGASFFDDVLVSFPQTWWVGGGALLLLGAFLIWKFPKTSAFKLRLVYLPVIALSVTMLFCLPEMVFQRDLEVWGTRSEYGQSSSYRATYNTMYDAKNLYDICGIYQLTFRDAWVHGIYPMTPAYREEIENQTEEINAYFKDRTDKEANEMTGIFADKNVVLVLMESIDDWMVTPEDTPTLYGMMQEGVNFTEMYTPGYGSARTINTEFCVNTGIYLPTTGEYVFDYVTNDFSQSIASQAKANGYTAEVFHYNTDEFYSRGVFEPAMGYDIYNSYGKYETDKNKLYDDCLLFEIPELSDRFFREGKTFNTIITRSAHLSYVYNEVLSYYALNKYPDYRFKYGSQEEDCARVKAKLVDDMLYRLVQELEARGQLKNTVIIGVTDHYTYGYKNTDELYELSGVDHKMLLEKTPCFVWSVDSPSVTVDKTMSTADFLPTMLNLLGYNSPYHYLGQDVFDPDYVGYAIFPNGSWISDGVVCEVAPGGKSTVIQNTKGKKITEVYLGQMAQESQKFIRISNLLLTSNYYQSLQ